MRKKRKRQNKIIRYLKVAKRNLKKLNRKKVKLWFKTNLRQHPFILGFLFIAWVDAALIKRSFTLKYIWRIVFFHVALFLIWVVLVTVSNLLKDKQKVKWYLRKRFVFLSLILFPPLGTIFLWSGSKFKRATKITLTIIFGALFIWAQVHYNNKYEKLAKKAPFERIMDMIAKPKKKVHLELAGKDVLSNFNLTALASQATKDKLPVSDIVSRCAPGVVSIKTKDKYGKDIGLGSGFLISPDGLIVTNFHVMESAYKAQVNIGDKIYKDVYFVRGLPEFDIAILKINSDNLPYLSLGNSDGLVDGQFIVVLGSPWGFEHSVSNGIVSAVRSKGSVKIIQMTAPVSPGSSGGPVLNEFGEVVGITTLASFFMAQNLNFAVPVNYLSNVLKEPSGLN